ncbi:hypothetical protein [Microtetraspora glauca]|uniref:Uncharacterized protein n=1 Tax=Microtetraspora glauca TaxID=1996 RepID=A0ABV3GJ23_MICGL
MDRSRQRDVTGRFFDFDADGRITAIHNVANPDELQAIADRTTRDVGMP